MDGLYPRHTQPPAAETENRDQDRKIFSIYGIYRVVLVLILLISFYYRTSTSPLGLIDPVLFVQICVGYAGFNLLTLLLPVLRLPPVTEGLIHIAIIVIDILALVAISFTCGGVSSGMAHLLIVPVASGSILFGIRISTFFAAVGSIAAIYAEIYLYLSTFALENYYVQAGLLGLTLFATSLSLQYLGGRIRQKELINRIQARSILSLQEMNQQIIQRMQTGIIVVDTNTRVLNCNDAARKLLTTHDKPMAEQAQLILPAVLVAQLQVWQADPRVLSEPFRLGADLTEIQASFTFLQAEPDANILIFLDDYSQLSSRAQHLKLMALGRLTASIAHEIRNPLGAISHASQLLEESTHADAEDQRLISIINTHTRRVSTIIQNILELSRHRQEAAEPIPAESWLEGFIGRFVNSYRDEVRSVLQVSPPDMMLRFNPSQLDQLLTNLCDNALRHSRLQTGVQSFALVAGIHPFTNCPMLDVIDDGAGVTPDKTEQIFEPFYTTETKGTGLGLFICREICEANQAQIFYRRTEEGKSCFRVIFAHPGRGAIQGGPGHFPLPTASNP